MLTHPFLDLSGNYGDLLLSVILVYVQPKIVNSENVALSSSILR